MPGLGPVGGQEQWGPGGFDAVTALLCAEQAWLGGFTLRQAENQQDRAQS